MNRFLTTLLATVCFSTPAFANGELCSKLLRASEAPVLETAAEPTRVMIEPSRTRGTIDPKLKGFFLEPMFGGIQVGVSAEKTRVTGALPKNFPLHPAPWNTLPPNMELLGGNLLNNVEWKFQIRTDDTAAQATKPGYQSDAKYSIYVETTNFRRGDENMERGFVETGLELENNKDYIVTIRAKAVGPGYPGDLRLSFGPPGAEQDEIYAQATIHGLSNTWQEYQVKLRPQIPSSLHPNGQDRAATFIIEPIGAPGEFLLDIPYSIMPADAVDGVNKDTFGALKKLRPTTARYGGLALSYSNDLMDLVGPKEARPAQNIGWTDELHPSEFGLQEYLKLCQNMKVAPVVTVNTHGDHAIEKTMALLSYLFDAPDSPNGRLRANAGLPNYRQEDIVIELGNETWLGGFQFDRPPNPAQAPNYGQGYADIVIRFAEAIHSRYPHVDLIASGDRNPDWYRPVIERAGRHFSKLALHWYHEWWNRDRLVLEPKEIEHLKNDILAFNQQVNPGHHMQIAFNEWNARLAMPFEHGIEPAIISANTWMMVIKNSPDFTMSTNAITVNAYPGNLINRDKYGRMFLTPLYYQNMLFFRRMGTKVVDVDVKGPVMKVENQDVTYLESAATESTDGKRLYVYIVNRNKTDAMPAKLDLGSQRVGRVQWEMLQADDLATRNTFSKPHEIRPKLVKTPQRTPKIEVILPKNSISVFTIQLVK